MSVWKPFIQNSEVYTANTEKAKKTAEPVLTQSNV